MNQIEKNLIKVRKMLIRNGPMSLRQIHENFPGNIPYDRLSKLVNYPIARIKYGIKHVEYSKFAVE